MTEAGADSPLESRVEDLFSNAVERQVAERRAVGRALEELGNLVKSLDERLGRIEGQGVTDAVSALGAQLDAVASQLGGQVAAPVDALAREMDERLNRLEAAEHGRGRESRDQADGLAEQVNAVTARLQDIVAEGVEQLARRQDEGQQSLERAVLSAAAAQAPAVDPGFIADTVLSRLPAAIVPAAIDVDLIADTVLSRMPAYPQAPAPVDVGVIAQAVIDRLGGVLPVPTSKEQILDAVRDGVPSAHQVASAVDASIRDGLLSVVDDIRAEVDGLRDELFAIRHEVTDGLSGIAPLSARLGTDIEDLGEAVSSVRLDIARTDGDRELLRDEITAVVGSLSADLRAAADDRDRQADVISDRLTSVVEGRLSQVIDERMTSLTDMRESLDGALDGLRTQMDQTVVQLGVVTELGATLTEQSARLDRLAIEMPEASAAAFDERAGSLAAELQGLVRDFATEIGSALASVAERAEAAQEANAAHVEDIGSTVAGFDKHLRNLRENLKRNTDDMSAQTAQLQAMAGDVNGMGATLGSVVGEMQAQMTADHEAAIARVREVLTIGEERLSRAGEAVVGQTDLAMEQLAAAAQVVDASSAGLREELAASLDEAATVARVDAEGARDELIAAGARLDLLFDRLAGFERAVIDHLAARDAGFSRERALIVEDLVEQLSGGLGKRERKRLASKLEVPAAASVASAGIEALQEPAAAVPAPATPAPGDRTVDVGDRASRSRVPEPSPIVPKVTAKKPTVKKSTAKKPAAKKSAAKKPAATKPVAKKPTTRRSVASRVTREDLIAVNGLGPAKADALIEAFGSPAKVATATVADLAAVPGISARLAAAVQDALS